MLEIISQNHRAKDALYAHISTATIVILDLSTFLRELLEALSEGFGIDVSWLGDPLEIISRRMIPRETAEAILRYAREHSIHSKDSDYQNRVGVTRRRCQGTFANEIWSHRSRRTRRDIRTGVSRTCHPVLIVNGEALHPNNLASITETRLREARFLNPGHVAVLSIEATLQRKHVFDAGSQRALMELDVSRQRLGTLLEGAMLAEVQRPISRGAVRHADSSRIHGIQAADIAVGVPREIFESGEGGTRQRAETVRRVFNRVLLNDEWL